MRITVTGPRSSGKSTTSKLLAEKLGYKHLETDALMDKRLEHLGGLDMAIKSDKIEEIILTGPEVVDEALSGEDIVLDLAGGAISSGKGNELGVCQKIIASIKSKSFVVGLLPFEDVEKSIEFLFEREKNREHWKSEDSLKLEERTRKDYLQISEAFPGVVSKVIYVGGKSAEEVVSEIMEVLDDK